jgi:hypothetical protein
MGKGPETKFKEKIFPYLKNLPNSWFTKIQQRAIRGTPDFLGCVNGYFVALELKKDEDEDLDLLQEYNIRNILNAGGCALRVSPENWDEILDILSQLALGKMKIKIAREKIKETLQ